MYRYLSSASGLVLLSPFMGFQAGYVNVGGMALTGQFVSHVTGASSHVSRGLGGWELYLALGGISVLLGFILGASIAGLILRNAGVKQGNLYTSVILTKVGFLALVFVGLEIELWVLDSDHTIVIASLMAVACGIHNAACSIATGGFLKPTHMTGLSTDLGVSIGRGIRNIFEGKVNEEERNKALIRASILISFILGGVCSALVFAQNGHYGLLFPIVSSIAIIGLVAHWEDRKQVLKKYTVSLATISLVVAWGATVIAGIAPLVAS